MTFYLRLGADALLIRSLGLLNQLVVLGGAGEREQWRCIGIGVEDLQPDTPNHSPFHHLLPSPFNPGATLPSGYLIPDLEGDFSLNAANVLSADLLIQRGGLTRLAPTHDLDARQLAGLARGLGPRAGMLEAIVHQHLPIFHTGNSTGFGIAV